MTEFRIASFSLLTNEIIVFSLTRPVVVAVVVLTPHRWFSRDVSNAMLVDENKRFLISSFCSSTSNCTMQHCYLCL